MKLAFINQKKTSSEKPTRIESGVKATSQQMVRKYRKLITQKFAKK